MRAPSHDRIILCQPDNNKGCSLCCGLFNFSDISPDYLSSFLHGGSERENKLITYDDYNTPSRIRDKFSHICPYQGFLSKDKPGCLIHPLSSGIEGRGRSLFASKICSEFFCPAHTVLSEEEKLFLIKNISSWYLYTVALSDPESYSFIYNYVKENYYDAICTDEADAYLLKALVIEGLAAHAENLAAYEGVIFCYSIPEYNINKKNFCISYINEARDRVVSCILKSLSSTN